MAKADPQVKAAILHAFTLREGGTVKGFSNDELREELGLSCSNTKFKVALGSLVKDGLLKLEREMPTSISSGHQRRITVRMVLAA